MRIRDLADNRKVTYHNNNEQHEKERLKLLPFKLKWENQDVGKKCLLLQ
jgi:hypothetical protein